MKYTKQLPHINKHEVYLREKQKQRGKILSKDKQCTLSTIVKTGSTQIEQKLFFFLFFV